MHRVYKTFFFEINIGIPTIEVEEPTRLSESRLSSLGEGIFKDVFYLKNV